MRNQSIELTLIIILLKKKTHRFCNVEKMVNWKWLNGKDLFDCSVVLIWNESEIGLASLVGIAAWSVSAAY